MTKKNQTTAAAFEVRRQEAMERTSAVLTAIKAKGRGTDIDQNDVSQLEAALDQLAGLERILGIKA